MKKLVNAGLPSGEAGIKEAMHKMIDGEVFIDEAENRHWFQSHQFQFHSKVTDMTCNYGRSDDRSTEKWQVVARSSRTEGKIKHLGSFRTHIAACYARWAHDAEIDELLRR